MESSRNDKIDFLLEYASSKVPCNFSAAISKLNQRFGNSNNKEYERLIVELISLRILRSVDEQGWSNFLVDELGFHILKKFNSFSEYENHKKAKDQKELELLTNNATIAMRTRRFMYVSLIIGFIGGISGLLNISSRLFPSTEAIKTSSETPEKQLDTQAQKANPVDSLKTEANTR